MGIIALLGRMPKQSIQLSVIAFAMLFLSYPQALHAQVAGMSSIIVDANTGEVLQSQGADTRRHPASITKVMTLYLLFEQLDAKKISMNTQMKVSRHAASQAPSKLGLSTNETLSVEDAIDALAIKSANDVAAVVAEHIGGTEANFAKMMTRKARALGMNKTVFMNASGLPNSNQVTTARDLALLGYAIQTRFPEYSKEFAKRSFSYNGRTMNGHNRLLGRVEGVDGIKTGYTRASGFNLLSSMRMNGRHVIGVVLGGNTSGARDEMMQSLLVENIEDASNKKYKLQQFAGLPVGNSTIAFNEDIESNNQNRLPKIKREATGKPIQLASIDPSNIILPPAKVANLTSSKSVPKPPRQDQNSELITSTTKSAQTMVWQSGAPAKTKDNSKDVTIAKNAPSKKAAQDNYAVQISPTETQKSANALLVKAQSKASKQLKSANAQTKTIKSKGDTSYRVQFSNLDKSTAESACIELKKNSIQCMITRL